MKKRYTAEKAFKDIHRAVSEYQSRNTEFIRQAEKNLGLRIGALEETGVDRTRIEKIEQDLRYLIKSERETKKVLEAILDLMRLGRDLFNDKQESVDTKSLKEL